MMQIPRGKLCIKYFTYCYTVAPYDATITVDFTGDVMTRPVSVEYGDVIALNCVSSDDPNNIFFWFKDGIYVDRNTDGILNITDVTADDGGLYECVVNNTAGSSSANITIYGMSVYDGK